MTDQELLDEARQVHDGLAEVGKRSAAATTRHATLLARAEQLGLAVDRKLEDLDPLASARAARDGRLGHATFQQELYAHRAENRAIAAELASLQEKLKELMAVARARGLAV